MKKLMAILTASAMLLALASCGEEPAETSSAAAPTTAPIVTPTVTPTTAPVISVDPVSSEPETPTAQNVALSGKAEDNGCALYSEAMSADLLIDGDTATEAWQPSTWNADGDYVIITFAEAAKIDCVVITGEAATFKAMAEGGYKLYTKNGEKWKEVKDAESDYVEGVDTVTFAEAIETDGIKVVLLDTNGYEDGKIKYAPKLNEIEVYEAIEETPAEESVEETAE